MYCVETRLDFQQNDLYHMLVSFRAEFLDTKGSPLDADYTGTVDYTLPDPASDLILNTFNAWVSNTTYTAGVSVVIYNGDYYLCATSNSDENFTSGNWTKINAWVSGTSYTTGNQAVFNGTVYQCTAANSDTTFNPGNWEVITS
jgi:hypothetical protein